MAFTDEITLTAKAGKGGDGVVRWLHLRGKEHGGPSGGNGGRGADVIIRGVRDLNVLRRYRGASKFNAENGEAGAKNEMEGKNGQPTYIDVPVGSRVTIVNSDKTFDILEEGEEHVVFKGGRGGLGNAHFKGSTNQYPERSTPGEAGESGKIFVEVRLIADVGLVGLPNAGKSSLLNAFTKTQARVAAYPFTTVEPALGVLYGYVVADIPGLIEGASSGKGLGHAFLRHIQRTRVLVHCVSAEHEDVVREYAAIRKELLNHDHALADKPEIIFLTKVDEISLDDRKEKIVALQAQNNHVVPVSILDDKLLKEAQDFLIKFLES